MCDRLIIYDEKLKYCVRIQPAQVLNNLVCEISQFWPGEILRA